MHLSRQQMKILHVLTRRLNTSFTDSFLCLLASRGLSEGVNSHSLQILSTGGLHADDRRPRCEKGPFVRDLVLLNIHRRAFSWRRLVVNYWESSLLLVNE
ncbi:hypothetical protein CDAR_62551 [Caerostris darwini]|uniref:Uncharacterized protein n=1 Tax=Caerostris darwini TaxID=1538125 RepID=A0AAV4UF52_9ARAC|nr:hypothetical protein CDAR_62551 [Caerostris darwini]